MTISQSDETSPETPIAAAVAPPARSDARAFALLAVVLATADVVAIDAAVGHAFPFPPLVLAYALILSQVSLAAMWAGLVSRNVLFGAVGLAMTYAVALPALNALHQNDGEWGILVMVQMAAVALPLLAARLTGLRLRRAAASYGRGRFQITQIRFTLRHLFLLTTSLAIFLAFARIVVQRLPAMQDWDEAQLLGGGFALVALLAIWASLGVGRLLVRSTVLAAGNLIIGWAFTRLVAIAPSDQFGVYCLVSADCCLLAASLAVLRRLGYRLVRQSAVT